MPFLDLVHPSSEKLPGEIEISREKAFRFLKENKPTRRDDFWKYLPLKALNNDESNQESLRYPPALFGRSAEQDQKVRDIWTRSLQHIPDQFLKNFMALSAGFGEIRTLREGLHKVDISNVWSAQTQIFRVEESCQILIQANATESAEISRRRLKNMIFVIAPNAHVEIMWITLCKTSDIELTQVQFFLNEKSRVDFFSLNTGGAIQKSFTQFIHEAPGARSQIRSLSICRGRSVIDHHTFVHHLVGGCSTSHIEKSIVSDEARFVFHGRVRIELDAQKADCAQLNHNLIEHDTAEVDSTPQLEILADDVKATHGFALGEIQEDEIFYLRSRGIDESEAKKLLKKAYARDLVDDIASAELRSAAEQFISQI